MDTIIPEQSATKDLTLPAWKVNLLSVFIILPLTTALVLGYSLLWGWDKLVGDLIVGYENYLITAFALLGGVVAHELLHALVWAVAGKLSFSSFKFGFNVSGMAPYAHCATPMPVRAYRWGAAAPGVLLGLIPFGLALLSGNAWLMSYGLIFTLVAAGDFLMLWKVRQLDSGDWVQDHPEKVGCQLVANK